LTTTAETVIADLDGELSAHVDGAGAVRLADRDWVLDWMVATEAGWQAVTDAGTLRQQLVERAPVVETTLRLDGGQLVHRAFVAADRDGASAAVVEVRNDSPHAVGLALVFRPASVGEAMPPVTWRRDGAGETIVSIDDHAVAVLPDPAGVVTADGDDDLVRALADAASESADAEGSTARGSGVARVALIRPLPHTLTTRVSLSPAAGVSPTRVADAEAVARGWARHTRGGCRVELPEPVLGDLVTASRAQVLLAVRADREDVGIGPAAADARLADALMSMGQGRLAAGLGARWLTRLGTRGLVDDGSASGVAATGATLEILGRAAPDLEVDEVQEWLPEVTGMLVGLDKTERRGEPHRWDRFWADAGRRGAVAVLRRVGQDDAADQVGARVRSPDGGRAATHGAEGILGTLDDRAPEAVSWRRMLAARAAIGQGRWPEDDLRWLLAATDRTGVMPLGVDDHLVAAEVVALWRDLGATERPDGTVMLLPAVRLRWLGHPLEAHDVAIGSGSVGFAIRWHGERPALLWETKGLEGRRLSCPGLDPDWSTTEARGDALLAVPSLAPVDTTTERSEPRDRPGGSFS
jgi:hypothetical protein